MRIAIDGKQFDTQPVKLVEHEFHVLKMLVLLAANSRRRELAIQLGNDQQRAFVLSVKIWEKSE